MRRIVVRMSKQAVTDLGLREGETFTHAGREGRVVTLTAATTDVFVELDVEESPALLGVPGEPPGADDV